MGPVEAGERRWARIVAPLALFALAFGVRILPIQNVLVEGRALFFGTDAYYHMRRIAYSIVHFPDSLDFDPYINFPQGGEPIWTPLFDWGSAALLRPFWGRMDGSELERMVVFLPPLLGAATVVALYFLARRHFGTGTAVIAGVILSVLSGHFWYSQVGFVDHHAAVALVSTGVLAAAMALLAGGSGRNGEWRATRSSTAAVGIGLGTSLLLWPGSLLHVGLIEVALVVFGLTRTERGGAIDFARTLAWAHAVAFVLLLPFGFGAHWTAWGSFSPVVLSKFQPWAMGIVGLAAAACAVAWRFDPAGASRSARAVSASLTAAALLLASGWAIPELLVGVGDAWEWFAKTDSFQGQVMESMPLFDDDGEFTWVVAFTRLSAFSVLVPVALCAGVAFAWREKNRAPLLLFYWWTAGLATVTIFQRRFFNSASVAVALLFAVCIVWLHRSLSRRAPLGVRPAVTALVAGLALFLLLPVFSSYGWDAANQIRRLQGKPLLVSPHTHRRAVIVEMANWLRVNTPAPSNWMNPRERPAYGILAPWTIGHILEYEARRPTVTDNFGDDIGRENYLLARRYYQSDEPAAVELLERLSVRYVVAQQAPNYLGEDPVPGSMFFALFRHDGSLFEAPPGEFSATAVAALTRHRLVFDARSLPGSGSPGDPPYKVFELVAGAQVVGDAAPGAPIRVTLPVRTNHGRAFVYTAATTATADGRYAIRLPYANRGGPPAVRVAPDYTFECRGDRRSVALDEAAVSQGERIEGPALCTTR